MRVSIRRSPSITTGLRRARACTRVASLRAWCQRISRSCVPSCGKVRCVCATVSVNGSRPPARWSLRGE